MKLVATPAVCWVRGKSSAPRPVQSRRRVWCLRGEGLPGREMLPACPPRQLPAGPLGVLWRPLPVLLHSRVPPPHCPAPLPSLLNLGRPAPSITPTPSKASAQHGKGTSAPQSQGCLESSCGGAMILASGPPGPELLTLLSLLPAPLSPCPPTRQNLLALCMCEHHPPLQ